MLNKLHKNPSKIKNRIGFLECLIMPSIPISYNVKILFFVEPFFLKGCSNSIVLTSPLISEINPLKYGYGSLIF